MLRELQQSMAISQAILALCGPRAPVAASPQVSQLLAAVAASGIPQFQHPRVPPALAAQLHAAAQAHFERACLSLQTTHGNDSLSVVQALAMKLQSTFTQLHEKKINEVAASRKAFQATQKQPFATDVLLYAFDQSQTPSRRERDQLAKLTGLTVEQVRVWFQNRRQRMKKRAPELEPRSSIELKDVIARVAAYRKAADEDFDDDDSGYCSDSDRDRAVTPLQPSRTSSFLVSSSGPRSYPAPYTPQELSSEFHCEPPVLRTATSFPPVHAQITTTTSELTRLMSRLTLRHRRQLPRSGTSSTASAATAAPPAKPSAKGSASKSTPSAPVRKTAVRKDPETGRKVAGRRSASAAAAASPSSSSALSSPALSPSAGPSSSSSATDTSTKPRKRAGPLRRKPAGKALARQASESSVASTSSSDSSRSTSYSSDFSLASDSSFTSVESAPTAAGMECFQPQQQPQFDPLAAFDFTQLFSSQPSDPLPQPVADFELPPDLLAGLQMPMDTAALPPPESTDFLALLNDPTIQDLLQSVQDMDVVAPQQMQESSTFNNTLDFGSVATSAFLDLGASTLPTFDAMFGLDASSFQDTLWNSPGFSLPITV